MNYSKEFNIQKSVVERIQYLENQRIKLESIFDKMPEGNLQIAPGSTPNSFRYYLRETTACKCGTYLDKSKASTKKTYAYKKYVKELLKGINTELKSLKKIQEMDLFDSVVETYKELSPAVIRYIDPLNVDDETFVKMWMSKTYKGLPFDKNDTTSFFSDKNERMRSKSELLIANTLFRMGIPYKYECPVERKNGECLYPDFTILDAKNRREVYWEHLGKMSDVSYVMKNIWKLEEYRQINIQLGINLFITYESATNALKTNEINRTIRIIMGQDR